MDWKKSILIVSLLAACDPGGRVEDYINLPAQEIRGYCGSACTMKLLNGCVHPDAILMFHGPDYYGLPLPTRDFEYWSRVIANHYPPALAEWYMEEGRFVTTTMSGQDAIDLGARQCQ